MERQTSLAFYSNWSSSSSKQQLQLNAGNTDDNSVSRNKDARLTYPSFIHRLPLLFFSFDTAEYRFAYLNWTFLLEFAIKSRDASITQSCLLIFLWHWWRHAGLPLNTFLFKWSFFSCHLKVRNTRKSGSNSPKRQREDSTGKIYFSNYYLTKQMETLSSWAISQVIPDIVSSLSLLRFHSQADVHRHNIACYVA